MPTPKPHTPAIELRWLPPHPHEQSPIFEMADEVLVHAYAGSNAQGQFHIAFGIGDGLAFTKVANAALERTVLHAGRKPTLFVQLVDRRDTAARRVVETLRAAKPGSLTFVGFADSELVDAGMAPLWHDPEIVVVDIEGKRIRKLTATERIRIQTEARAIRAKRMPKQQTRRLQQSLFRGIVRGRERLVSVALTAGPVTGRHLEQVSDRIGGGRVIIVEVLKPTNGAGGRSSIAAVEAIADMVDSPTFSVVHAAANLETYRSIVAEFETAGWKKAKSPNPAQPLKAEIMSADWSGDNVGGDSAD